MSLFQFPALTLMSAALFLSSTSGLPSPSHARRPAGGQETPLLQQLFPISQNNSWTTAPEAASPLPLSDATFRPFDVIDALTHTYTNAPDGTFAMQAHYPIDSFNFQHMPQGGFSFYAPGPTEFDLTTAKEATFGYRVFFQEGFEFNMGGKLPGLCTYDAFILAGVTHAIF